MNQNPTMGGMPMPQPMNPDMYTGMNPGNPNASGAGGVPNSPAGMSNPPAGLPNTSLGGAPAIAPSAPAIAPSAPSAPAARKSGIGSELIILIAVCVIAAIAIVSAVYFFVQYNELNASFEAKLAYQEPIIRTDQMRMDEENFMAREKEPFSHYTGPSDYGSVYIEYPKNWNCYVSSDGTNNSDFEAFFAPEGVPSVQDASSRYALRFIIRNAQLESIQSTYDSMVSDGSVVSSQYSSQNGKISGTIFTGKVSEGIDGSVLVAKVNDKTLILQTDSNEEFGGDFQKILEKLRRVA